MEEAPTPKDPRGWALFCKCFEIVLSEWSESEKDSILAARREGVTGPRFARQFVHAFEAAIDTYRQANNEPKLRELLAEASEINFVHQGDIYRVPENRYNDDQLKEIRARKTFELFARCFACAVARSNCIPPKPFRLIEEFERCRSAWESETVEYDLIAPVPGLLPHAASKLHFGNGLTLSYHDDVVWDGIRPQFDRYMDGPVTVLHARHAIKKTDDVDVFFNDCLQHLTRCVTAVRLATGKVVGCPMAFLFPGPASHQTSNHHHVWHNDLLETVVSYNEKPIVGLSQSEADQASTLITTLNGNAGKQMNVATRRYNIGIGRHDVEDEIIDLTIALESTLCRQKFQEQLAYRFRVFGAAAVADICDPEKAINLLNALYDIRSAIVHSGRRFRDLPTHERYKKWFQEYSGQQFVKECRDLTRKIILAFLDQASKGRSPDKYVEDLQKVMVRTAKKTLTVEEAEKSG